MRSPVDKMSSCRRSFVSRGWQCVSPLFSVVFCRFGMTPFSPPKNSPHSPLLAHQQQQPPSTSTTRTASEASNIGGDGGESDKIMAKQTERNNSMELEERENGISTHLTLINFMKGMIGSGILTLPIVFKQAGLWTAFGLVFLFGALNTVTMHMLVRSAHHLARTKREADGEPMSYGEVMHESLAGSFPWARPYAKTSKLFVNATIVVLQMGIGVLKYDFIVAHLRELFDEFTSFHVSAFVWALLIFAPMVLLNFIRTLRRIALLSSIGNVFMFGAYGIIFYHLLQPPYRIANLPWWNTPAGILSACGSILYCFEGQAMVLPMENKMRFPAEMVSPFGVLSTGMALTAIFDAAVGFLGYAKFGEHIQGSVTLNLAPTPLLILVRLIFTGISFLDFVLQQYVTIQMLWPSLRSRICCHDEDGEDSNRNNSTTAATTPPLLFVNLCEYLFRAILVATTMLIAIGVPNLEQIMPLVGFSGGVFLAFVFPPLIDTFTFVPSLMDSQQRVKLCKRLARNACFIAIGLFGTGKIILTNEDRTTLDRIFKFQADHAS
uniref:Amino acid transporter transmembrane domain-containing protein n=1 Tax=Globodera rostochiensis TaxID=31243 RepID=A0A914GZM5_GLORO